MIWDGLERSCWRCLHELRITVVSKENEMGIVGIRGNTYYS